jgi:hypothetical protein
LGWCSNFVGFESGQKQRVKTPAEYGLQHNSTPPTPTHCLYILNVDFGKGGGVGKVNQRKGRGAIVHKAESKIPT